MEIPAYPRPSKAQQLFSFLSASTAAALGLILTCCSLGPCHPTLMPYPCAFRCTVALRGGVNDGSSPSPKRVTESHTESISPGKSHSEGPRLSWELLPSLAFLLRLLPATTRHQAQLTSLAHSLQAVPRSHTRHSGASDGLSKDDPFQGTLRAQSLRAARSPEHQLCSPAEGQTLPPQQRL